MTFDERGKTLMEHSGAQKNSHPLGLPLIWVVALAALGVPRVIAHDLDLVGPAVNSLLVFAPVIVWLVVVPAKRVPNPFWTLLAIGAVYGVLLAATHQVLWVYSYDGDPPSLGGNLAGALPPGAEAVVLRVFAFFSSLLTGVGVGAAAGVLAWVPARVLPGWRPRKRN
jgi:hypothetical protein